MGVYNIYVFVTDILFNEVTSTFYVLESLVFLSWAIIIMTRSEIKTLPDINKDNILLAFYKGDKGSFIMRFFELFGLPVKSMCVISGEKALYLKSNKDTFQLKDSKYIYRKEEDYVILDTGVKNNLKFSEEMEKCATLEARKLGFRICCIEAVRNLLGLIGDEWKPKHMHYNIPSLYLKKCSKI